MTAAATAAATAATAAAAALTAAVLGLAAPAAAAPSGSDAQQTISQLEADGNRVIVNRLSDTPLSQATVVAVQPGPALRGTVPNRLQRRQPPGRRHRPGLLRRHPLSG